MAAGGEQLELPDPDAAPAVGPPDGLGVEQVRDAEEISDVGRRRLLVDLAGRADLLDPALVHHREAVGHREGLFLVVRDVDEGYADLLLQGLQLDLERLAELGVERAERLVQQQHRGVEDQSARERHPLLLAPRELVRLAVAELLHLHEGERLSDPGAGLLPGRPREAQPEGDVLGDRQVGEEGVALEHGVDVALVRRGVRDVLAVEQDPSPAGTLEAGDHAQRRGLAAPARAEQREELARRDVQVYAAHRLEGAVALGEVDELDAPPAASSSRSSPSARAKASKLSTKRLASSSECCTESVHCSALPHGGKKTPPLCWKSQCAWLKRSSSPRKSR